MVFNSPFLVALEIQFWYKVYDFLFSARQTNSMAENDYYYCYSEVIYHLPSQVLSKRACKANSEALANHLSLL
jgi:hypothetical protein